MARKLIIGRWLLCVLTATVPLAAVLLVSARHCEMASGFNSDDLGPVDFCDDILQHRWMPGWEIPGQRFLFPHAALLLPCRWAISSLPLSMLAYDVLFVFLLALVLAWLGREASWSWSEAWLASCLGIGFWLTINLMPVCDPQFIYCPHTHMHLELLPVGIALLALLLRGLRRGFRPWELGLAAVCCGLGAFSDNLLIVQFIVPAALALLLFLVAKKISVRATVVAGLLLAASVALAFLVEQIFVWLGFRFLKTSNYLKLANWAEIRDNVRDYWRVLQPQDLQCVLCMLFPLAGLPLVLKHWPRAGHPRRFAACALGVFLLLAYLSSLVLFLIMGRQDAAAMVRYSYCFTMLPPLAFPLVVALLAGTARRRLVGVCWLAIVLFIGYRLTTEFLNNGFPRFEQPYPELAQRLDDLARERGYIRGLAGYWHARYMRYVTKCHVQLLPVERDGRPYLHIANPERWLSDDPADLAVPEYRFIVVDKLKSEPAGCPSADIVQEEFGPPRERIPAGGSFEIWLYDRLQSPRFQVFLDSLLSRRYERSMAWVAPSSLLGRPKDGYLTPREADRVLAVGNATETTVRFAQPVSGRVVDVSADCDARFCMTFFNGGQKLGTLEVPPVCWPGTPEGYGSPGLRSRLVVVPQAVRSAGWDRIDVRCPKSASAAIGHLLVFRDASELAELPLPSRR